MSFRVSPIPLEQAQEWVRGGSSKKDDLTRREENGEEEEARVVSLDGWKRELYWFLYCPRRRSECLMRLSDVPPESVRRELGFWYRQRL